MKLLFETIPNSINVDALEKYRLKQCSETIIYSEEGIFSIQNNSLYKEDYKYIKKPDKNIKTYLKKKIYFKFIIIIFKIS